MGERPASYRPRRHPRTPDDCPQSASGRGLHRYPAHGPAERGLVHARCPAPGTTGDPTAGDFHVAFGRGLGEPGRDGALLLSQPEDEATFTAELPTPAFAGSAAGIGVRADALHQFSLLVRLDGTDRSVDLRRQADDLVTRHSITLPGHGPTRLGIDATADAYRFYADDHPIGQGSARLLSAETAEAFVGVAFALLAVGPNTLPPALFRHVHLDAARK